mmetsp:Transcript_13850/g.18146  ORF Transcript_13850/g.18146 Transcript_13850/m.18146 type:complete len:98 (-) Transcript_13850:1632-1925(-)
MIVVLPSTALSIASCTRCSDSASNADVASSKSSMRQSVISARAIDILCFCPPDSWIPLSPTIVSYPSGQDIMKSWQFALRHASSIIACVTTTPSGTP